MLAARKINGGNPPRAVALVATQWAEMARARVGAVPLPHWVPTPRQSQALDSQADELLYGGAAGGGKSEYLLALARTRHKSILLLRRTFAELDRNLIPRAKSIYRETYNYNNSAHRWTFPDGCRVQFGHMQRAEDYEQYRSDEYDLIGFDELTEFNRVQYEFMVSRLRTSLPGQRVRLVATTNPGGVGADWVIERFAAWLDPASPRPAAPGELRYYARVGGKDTEVDGPGERLIDGELVTPMSRTFIPARVEDNPHLGPDYAARLRTLPEPFRSQLLLGDWAIGKAEDAKAVIPRAWLRAANERWQELPPPNPVSAVGVDVARGGADRTVIAIRRGAWVDRLLTVPGAATQSGKAVVNLFAPHIADGGVAAVDCIGIGAAVIDAAREAGVAVDPVNFGEGTGERDSSGVYEFANIRALAYWRLREALDPNGEDPLALPPDPELFAELASARYEMTATGKIKIEPKDDIKERLGRSPDKADAVALSLQGRKPFNAGAYLAALRGGIK